VQILKDYLKPGEIVLDPYLGSGTTCIAAKILGFKSIGIEQSQSYYHKAISRCSSLLATLKEFLRRIWKKIGGDLNGRAFVSTSSCRNFGG